MQDREYKADPGSQDLLPPPGLCAALTVWWGKHGTAHGSRSCREDAEFTVFGAHLCWAHNAKLMMGMGLELRAELVPGWVARADLALFVGLGLVSVVDAAERERAGSGL